jgi:predicted RNase H-like nuclease (RuvC/YqgF family)
MNAETAGCKKGVEEVAENKNVSHKEVKALREEVKNLASQVNTAVTRIQELESEKDGPGEVKPSGQELPMQEEVQALREEVKNLAAALNTAVERVRELEQKSN